MPNQLDMENFNNKQNIDSSILASVVFFSDDSIIITDTQLDAPGPHIKYVNPGFVKVFGYEPEEVLGKSPRIFQGPKTDQSTLRRLRETLDRNEVFHGCALNYRKDGTEFWNEWHIEAIWDKTNKKARYYIAIQRDVTQRILAQQKIEQKNMALREILEHIEIEKKRIKENVASNVDQILLPALKKLYRKGTRLDKKYLDILEQSLIEMAEPFTADYSNKELILSPREMEVANLIKNNLSSKEICQMLNLSFKTVETHRNRIRKKLGLVNEGINLTSYLQKKNSNE